jgi:hypothetical protein
MEAHVTMSERARDRVADDEPIPVPVSHEEKTVEVAAVPEPIVSNEDTVPVHSSLEKILHHEVLRQRSRDDSGAEES